MKRLLRLALALVPSLAWGATTVHSEWVLPTRPVRNFELRPHERTRPVLVGDILYVANLDARLYALHRKGGYVLWERRLRGGVEGALAYGRSKLFVGDRAGNFAALNTRDGSEEWRVTVKGEWLSPPTVARDRVYAVTSNDEVYAFSTEDGKEIWRYSRRGDEKMTVRGSSAPTVSGGELYVGFSDGNVVALSAEAGEELWVKRLRTRERFYDVDIAPVVTDKAVFVATFDGNVYRLERATGKVEWTYGAGSYGGMLLDGDRLYFAGLDGHFHAVDAAKGASLWRVAFEQGVGLQPTRVGDHLVIPTSSDPLYVLDVKTGSPVAQLRLGAGTLAPVAALADEWFYALSNYGNLRAFTLRDLPVAAPSTRTLAAPSALRRP